VPEGEAHLEAPGVVGQGRRLGHRRPDPGAAGEPVEAGGRHPHDRERHLVQADGLAEHRRIAVEAAAPEVPAQHRHRRAARRLLPGHEQAPEPRFDPEQVEVAVGDELDAEPLGLAGAGQVEVAPAERGHLLEGGRRRGLVGGEERVRPRDVPRRLGGVVRGQGEPQLRQPVGLAVGRIAQDHVVDHAEDRGRHADAQGEGEHRAESEGGAPGERPDGLPQVGGEGAHRPPPAFRARSTSPFGCMTWRSLSTVV
jgi:hypothetical protein